MPTNVDKIILFDTYVKYEFKKIAKANLNKSSRFYLLFLYFIMCKENLKPNKNFIGKIFTQNND